MSDSSARIGFRRRSVMGRLSAAGLAAVVLTGLPGRIDTVAAASEWSSEQELSDGSSFPRDLVSALSDDGSTAVAAWRRSDGMNNRIEVATASIGVGGAVWTTPFAISEAGRSASDPSVAISADGSTVLLAWDRSDGSRTRAQAVVGTITNGVAAWGPVATLSIAGSNSNYVDASLDGDGTLALVAWQRYDGTVWRTETVTGTIAAGSATWGTPSWVSAAGIRVYTPDGALARNGGSAGVVWWADDSDDLVHAVTATTSGLATNFGTSLDLSAAGRNANTQSLEIESGVAIATWLRTNGSHWIVQMRSATIGAGTPTWEPVVDLSVAGQSASYPTLDMDANASVSVSAWTRSNGSHAIVQVRTATLSAATTTWSPTVDLSAAGYNASYTHAAVSADGDRATVIWERPDGSGVSRIQVSSADLVDGSATWSGALDLSAPGENATQPLISLSHDGEIALAVWWGEAGGAFSVRSRVFAPAPVPVVIPPPSSSTTEPPSSSTTEPPSSSTTEPPSSSTTEPPSSSTTEPPSSSTTEPPSSSTTEPDDSVTTSTPVEILMRIADSLPVVAAEDIVDGLRIDADVVEARVGGFEALETVFGAIGPEIVSAVTAQADESGVVEMRLPVREARSAGAELILYAPVSGRGGRIPLDVEATATIELPATGFDPTWTLSAALAVAVGLALTLRRRIL